jgi:endonuclease/exonuclease/phosphatase family metal-dependent hydrolase
MPIKILQWNVWFKEDIDRVVDVLKELNADIICLQELTQGYHEQSKDNTWEHIQDELGYYGVHQTIPVITESEKWMQANAIFSRYPIIDHREHWLHKPKDLNDINDQFRGYLEADIDVGGKLLVVGTSHMSFRDYDGDEDLELATFLNATKQRNQRYIFTADLNATPDSERVARLSERFIHAGPSFSENTWTTKEHMTHLFEASTLDWRYDYVFTTDDIEVVKAQIIDTDISDHLPVLISANLPD